MATELTKIPNITPGTVSVMTPQGYEAALGLAKTLVESGFLPRAIQRPAQALAIILAGQELGLPPMTALRQIHVVEGKPVLSAELMLSLFKKRGGQAKWLESTDQKAELWLKHPNGDEHTESFTWQDAQRAGVAGKDNWRKYPKAMLKARVISAGIRAIGEADGMYMPEELGAEPAPADLQAEYTPPAPKDGVESTPSKPTATAATGPSGTAEAAADQGKESAPPPSPLHVVTAEPGESGPAGSTSREPGAGDGEDEIAGDELERVWCYDPETGEQLRQEPKASRSQIARIHILRVECGLTEEEYHKRLKELFCKESTAELSVREASTALDKLEERKKRWGGAKERQARETAKNARKAQRAAPENVPPEMRELLEEDHPNT